MPILNLKHLGLGFEQSAESVAESNQWISDVLSKMYADQAVGFPPETLSPYFDVRIEKLYEPKYFKYDSSFEIINPNTEYRIKIIYTAKTSGFLTELYFGSRFKFISPAVTAQKRTDVVTLNGRDITQDRYTTPVEFVEGDEICYYASFATWEYYYPANEAGKLDRANSLWDQIRVGIAWYVYSTDPADKLYDLRGNPKNEVSQGVYIKYMPNIYAGIWQYWTDAIQNYVFDYAVAELEKQFEPIPEVQTFLVPEEISVPEGTILPYETPVIQEQLLRSLAPVTETIQTATAQTVIPDYPIQHPILQYLKI